MRPAGHTVNDVTGLKDLGACGQPRYENRRLVNNEGKVMSNLTNFPVDQTKQRTKGDLVEAVKVCIVRGRSPESSPVEGEAGFL